MVQTMSSTLKIYLRLSGARGKIIVGITHLLVVERLLFKIIKIISAEKHFAANCPIS